MTDSLEKVRRKGKIKLRGRREAFALHYVANGGNGTKAAISAGYSERSAHTTASEILKDPEVQAKLDEVRKYVYQAQQITPDQIRAGVLKEALDAPNSRERLQGWQMLGKDKGMFDGRQLDALESMSDEQLLEAAKLVFGEAGSRAAARKMGLISG